MNDWERGGLDNGWEVVWKLAASRPHVAPVLSVSVFYHVLMGIRPLDQQVLT